MDYFRNFAIRDSEITLSRKKKKRVSLFCAQLFVTLHTKPTNKQYEKTSDHHFNILRRHDGGRRARATITEDPC